MKKKLFFICLSCFLLAFAFCGCGEKTEAPVDESEETLSVSEEQTPQNALEHTAAYLNDRVTDYVTSDLAGDWIVIGFSGGNCKVPDKLFEKYYALYEQGVAEVQGVLDDTTYSTYARAALAVTAMGKDPRNVGGYDLLTPLADTEKVLSQGTNGPIWALIALNGASFEWEEASALADSYLSVLLSRQNEDGSFALTEGGEGEVDITAMALQALAFYKDREDVAAAIDRSLNYLSNVQQEDGGFIYWDESNSESISQVLIALSALGISYDDPRFVKGENTLFDALMTFCLEDGSFIHAKKIQQADMMATEQAFCALSAVCRCENGQPSLYDMTK